MHVRETRKEERKGSAIRKRKSSALTVHSDPNQSSLDNSQCGMRIEYSPVAKKVQKEDNVPSTGACTNSPLLESPHKAHSYSDVQFSNDHRKLDRCVPEPKGISEKHRAAILDWIVEVLAVYKQSDVTLFRCAYIIDSFYTNSNDASSLDIHLSGAAAIVLASKFDNVKYLKISDMQDKICQKKFSKEQLVQRELEMAVATRFGVATPTQPELLGTAIDSLPIQASLKAFLSNSAMMLLRMFLFSVDLRKELCAAEITGFSLVLAIHLLERLKPEVKNYMLSDAVVKKFRLAGPLYMQKLQTLHQFSLKFESIGPNAKNLTKYHTFSKSL